MAEDREAKVQIIEAKKRRLQKLRVQAAHFGASVDPSISIEIEDLEEDIRALEAALNPPPKKATARKPSSPKLWKGPSGEFNYAASSLADVDFPMPHGHKITDIVSDLRITTWHVQSRAIEAMFKLKWPEVTADEAFVLGRNLYQVACGGEFRAEAIIRDLRRELARIPDDWAVHVVNGMFYEIYFNHKNEFRGAQNLKSRYMDEVFEVETVAKYAECVQFIRSALEPYRGQLGVLPSTDPEVLVAELTVRPGNPAIITSITCEGTEQLIDRPNEHDDESLRNFSLSSIQETLRKLWRLPKGHFKVELDKDLEPGSKLKITKTKALGVLTL
jgi:hypothetical protein